MYHEKMISVAKIENGYLVEVRAPYKVKKDEDDGKDTCRCYDNGLRYGEKEIYAADAADLGKKIESLMPLLETEFESEDAFEGAFKMASKT